MRNKRRETRDQGRETRWASLLSVLCLLSVPFSLSAADSAADKPSLIVVMGAAGEAEFAQEFREQFETWKKIGATAGASTILIGDGEGETPTDRERVEKAIAAEPKQGAAELWLVLLGHGTFDGKEAKFNLRGPDLTASDLAGWLKPITRTIAVVDTSSSSAPFMAKLAGPKRVVVTSTRSGYQQNYSRFGKFFTEAIAQAKADLDKDGQVSLLEAFLSGAHRTAEFYKTEGRLATEHALIDDNGDGLGTPADWFRGVRATKKSRDAAPVDGARAHQLHLVRSEAEQQLSADMRARRDKLELEISKLRDAKPKMTEAAYYEELEKLFTQLAELYHGT